MNTELILIFAGPAFSLLALCLLAIPRLRPKTMRRAFVAAGIAMTIPCIPGLAFHSDDLMIVAFLIKPVVAFVAGSLFLGYLMLWGSRRYPAISLMSPLILLCGGLTDLHVVRLLGPGLGGASC